MTPSHPTDDDRARSEDVRIADLLAPLANKSRWITHVTFIVTGIVLLVALSAFFLQPVRRSVSAGFRPQFQGADEGRYPNGTPFAGADIVQGAVVDRIYEANTIKDYCGVEAFRSAFTVHESSPGLHFLEAEFQARLSDARLTVVDRQGLLAEFERRRGALARQYEIRFIPSGDCEDVPDQVASKVVTDTLERWAKDAIEKRGVLRVRVAVISPSLVSEAGQNVSNLLVRADMVRRAVRRVIQNIREVERVPGAEAIRGSSKQVSFLEVRVELEDLVQARLDPLVLRAGRLVGAGAQNWIQQAVQTSTIEHRAAEQRAEAYRTAMREYAGVSVTPATTGDAGSGRGPGDVQSLTPQIDRTFIDRIVEMSEVNTTFRQEITRDLIEASVEAVERAAVMEQYRQLQAAASTGPVADTMEGDVTQALQRISQEATESTKRFNEVFQTFSDSALRAGSSLYELESPPSTIALRDIGLRPVMLAVLATLILTPLLAAILLVLFHQVRRLIPTGPRSNTATG